MSSKTYIFCFEMESVSYWPGTSPRRPGQQLPGLHVSTSQFTWLGSQVLITVPHFYISCKDLNSSGSHCYKANHFTDSDLSTPRISRMSNCILEGMVFQADFSSRHRDHVPECDASHLSDSLIQNFISDSGC